MKPETLEAKATIQILKPPHDVYEAIVDPVHMTRYFTSKGSGRLEEGRTVTWAFPEFTFEFPVRGGRMEKDRLVSFDWDNEGTELHVEITLTAFKGSTVVAVSEKGMPNDEKGLKWLVGNTAGWAGFLACLKAYLEYGINLRKGAYEFMRS